MMGRKCLVLFAVFALTTVLLTPSLMAYDQQDLEGTWDVYVWNTNCPFGNQCWDRCELTVGTGGIVNAGSTYSNWLGEGCTVTGGRLVVSANGDIEGTIETSQGLIDVAQGGLVDNDMVLKMAE